ncbi:MAG: DNA mismatch repair endonuclease MutL [Bdellovibrionaceae bacterium]|nr:DNA mismatch repair endonuclease MutL [Pseudobdellovibrionaceae bacterium]
MNIQVLSSEVIDQIAAGEVVERPAHLVKELIENAIDAGALEVEIDFSEGGRRVRVTDNGKGMCADDLCRAFDRHATSKIVESGDLWKLQTYGFRGEALASIAAVSQITAVSRMAHESLATRLQIAFGQKRESESVAGIVGTTVLVTGLFENIPARRKFLKSDAAETNQIRLVIKALALSHPEVGFRWLEAGQMQAFWPAVETHVNRAEQVLDLQGLFEGEFVGDGVQVRAAMASPETVAKTAKNIWIFAQRRWIQDRALTAACMEAYRNLLMHGEYPSCCLWIETAPDQIDVNVHPTKSQVKFQEPSQIFRAVFHALRDQLEKGPWLKTRQPMGASPFQGAPPSSPFLGEQKKFYAAELEQVQYQQKSFQAAPITYSVESEFQTPDVPSEAISVQLGPWSRLQVLGQAAQTYIICQSGEALVLIDQHAAHERVAFEKLLEAWNGGVRLEVQTFLFPLSLDLSESQIEALETQKDLLLKLGIEWERLGPLTLGITSAPLILKDRALVEALDRLAHELVDLGQSFVFEKYLADLFATMACHSVVRAGQALSIPQMQELLTQMDKYPLSSYCPHGRPVSVEMAFQKLEKDFGRKV